MNCRTHALRETAFDTLATEESWYWLGLLLADGCVFTRRGGREWLLQLKLHACDRGVVEGLAQFIGYEGQLRSVGPHVALVVYSKPLCQRLLALGVVPRKSFDGHPLPAVPARFMFAFARGHFDGNGHIFQRTRRSFRLGFCGQPRLMDWFRERMRQLVGVEHGDLRHVVGCGTLTYGRRSEVGALARWLLGHDDGGSGKPFMPRKRTLLEHLAGSCT